MAKYSPQEIENRKYFTDKLNYLTKLNEKKQVDLHRDLGIPKSTLTGYYKGTSLPNPGNLQKIADYFKVVKSELDLRFRDGEPTTTLSRNNPTLNETDNKQEPDLSQQLEQMIAELAAQKNSLMFRGELMDDETKEAVLMAMQQASKIAELSLKSKKQKDKKD